MLLPKLLLKVCLFRENIISATLLCVCGAVSFTALKKFRIVLYLNEMESGNDDPMLLLLFCKQHSVHLLNTDDCEIIDVYPPSCSVEK